MKKIYFYAIALTIGLSSCSKSLDAPDSDEVTPTPMAFSNRTISNTDTKAGEQTTDGWEDGDTFGVYAKITEGDFADKIFASEFYLTNEAISWAALNIWSYANVKYWPNDPNKKITFVAYHPNTSEAGSVKTAPTTVNGNFTIPFVVNDVSTAQEDLLYDVVKNASKNDVNGAGTGVGDKKTKFTFEHALAKLTFSVKQAQETYVGVSNISITELKVVGEQITSAGSLSLGTNLDGTPTWTLGAKDAKTYEIPATGALTGVTPQTHIMLMIPQKNVDGANKLTITVKYAVNYTDDVVLNDVYTWELDYNWEMAHNHQYNMTIGLNAIEFAISEVVSVWKEGTANDLNN